MRRAALITDIVKSISVIPDPIVRQMYVRECAAMMDVDEKLVVNEVAKGRRAIREARSRAGQKTEEGQPSVSSESESPEAATSTEEAPLPDVPPAAASIEERQLMQLLVRYGEMPAGAPAAPDGGEPVSVVDYVASDLAAEGLDFKNSLYARMLKEATEHAHEDGFTASGYFMNHPDPAVSRAAAELMADRYTLSRYHFKTGKENGDETVEQLMAESPLNDRNRLGELTPRLLMDFKYAVVKEELKSILQAMNQSSMAACPEDCRKLMTHYMQLSAVERKLAQALGDRVVTP